MAKRAYGQYCGLARALEMVGERWAILILRDLMVGPRRYTDLRHGLPRIPTNILAARLRELEDSGLVARRILPRPSGAVVYELTDYGRSLEPALVALGRWGAQRLGDPAADEVVTADSMSMAMRTTFRAEDARDVSARFELRMGPIILGVNVDRGNLKVIDATSGDATRAAPDLVIEAGPGIKALMAGELTADEAIETGAVQVAGDASMLAVFARLFRI